MLQNYKLMKKTVLFWIIAIIITLLSSVYTRMTGPTKPVRGTVEVADETIPYRLIRTHDQPSDAPVRIKAGNRDIEGYYRVRLYPSYEPWDTLKLVRENEHLVAYIPELPAAGKAKYQIVLETDEESVVVNEEPVIIRFRDAVPAWALTPHIIFMFAAMLFSMRAGIAALAREKTWNYALWTIVTLILGGLVFGPIVQKYAFGDWWTGWPWGTDLTDNKTAVSFIFWVIAFFKVRKNPYHRSWVLAAAIVLFVIYLIPHSMLGSEIDWTQEPPQ